MSSRKTSVLTSARWSGRGLVVIAAGATAMLIIVDLAIRIYHHYVEPVPALRWVFNVGAEANLATWWNSTLLLSVAGMALTAAVLARPESRPGRISWLGLAAAAAWLSIDETVQVHERLADPGRYLARTLGLSVPTYAWALPGAILAVAAMVGALLWARRLPRDLRIGILGALTTYLTGALIVEAFNGWANRRNADVVYAIGTSVEESMEMGACLLALATLSKYVLLTRDPHTDNPTLSLR